MADHRGRDNAHSPIRDKARRIATVSFERSDTSPPREAHNKQMEFQDVIPAGLIREVARRSRTQLPRINQSGDQVSTESMASQGVAPSLPCRNSPRKFIRDYAFYCTSLGMIPGIISVSQHLITFEPDRRGFEVNALGVGEFQVVIPIKTIAETAAVILPRTRAIADLFNLPEDIEDSIKPLWARRSEDTDQPDGQSGHDPAIGLIQILLKADSVHVPSSSAGGKQKRRGRGEGRLSPFMHSTTVGPIIGRGSFGSSIQSSPPSIPFPEPPAPVGVRTRAHAVTVDTVVEGPLPKEARRRSAARLADMRTTTGQGSRPRFGTVSSTGSQESAWARRRREGTLRHSSEEGLGHTSPGECTPRASIDSSSQPKYIVLFRLCSIQLVRDVTRVLLELIDEHKQQAEVSASSAGPDGHEPPAEEHQMAYVPQLSNEGLDLLMQLCIDRDEDVHGPGSTQVLSALPPPTCEWLFRTSPPKLELPLGVAPLFTKTMGLQLSSVLPPTVALRKWHLLFDTSLHGVSLLSFFRHVEGYAPALLLIRDNHENVFGGYSPVGFQESRHYYGNGEAFVLSFNCSTPSEEQRTLFPEGPWLQVYTWSGLNPFFVYTDTERIMFGGGGSFAFTVDAGLLQGSSGCTSTYQNQPLTESEDFQIHKMQIWGFERL